MADLPTITLRDGELAAYRAAVIACARADEADRCERLLGQLASVEAQGATGGVAFTPAPRTAPLAQRALTRLRGVRTGDAAP